LFGLARRVDDDDSQFDAMGLRALSMNPGSELKN